MFFPEDDSIDYLFDTSGGRGEIPLAVPGHNKARLVGFAGGITPENVLRWIGSVNAQNYWIDMESGVRTDDWLDLDKCEAVCRAIWGEKL
jgi:phosphoribosylanthranilate isomerase